LNHQAILLIIILHLSCWKTACACLLQPAYCVLTCCLALLLLLLPLLQDAAEAAVPEAFEAFDEHVPAAAAAAPAATIRTGNTGVGSNMQTNTAKRGMRGEWQCCTTLLFHSSAAVLLQVSGQHCAAVW
jgi:hypothetical protein